ncbi:MAG: SAM-dependent methyltransferase [Bacteroidetes bacterium]|nr:MAG: SAM-dependent methyltransferase [Bacteroidota bacterium]
MRPNIIAHPSSYRDPSGFIFEKDGVLYRQINLSFKEHFDHFIQSGCYENLVKKGLIVAHENVGENLTGDDNYYKTVQPQRLDFISYPYEWSFDRLKDAALLTLQLVKEALVFDMILKDATAFNVQWHDGRLLFIDTLSFEKYSETPWIAYRQFCENFLAPLLIMHHSKKQMPGLFLSWPDGIPLDIASSLLPKRSRFSLYTYLHIHLHAKISAKKNEGSHQPQALSRQKLLNLISSLESLVNKLKIPEQKSTWSEYYAEAGQRKDYLEQKKKIIKAWLDKMPGLQLAADLGANEGEFSQLLAEKNVSVVAADFDPYCINRLYNKIKETKERNIQPLVIDLANPSPGTGVNNEERTSFINRLNTDLVLALALIHHLAIGKNIPFDRIAELFGQTCKNLVIEFVPKDDEKIQLMLSQKKDIYTGYTEENFRKALERYFIIIDKASIPGSGRILFLLTKNEG